MNNGLPDSEKNARQHSASAALIAAHRLFQQNDVDGAVSILLNQGIKADPTSPHPYLVLAEILIAAGRYNDALQVLPEMPQTSNRELVNEIAAICHAALGNDEAAHQAALHANGRPRSLVVLGTLSARRGDMAKAESFFRRAIAVEPSCGSAWLSLGMLLWSQGKQEQAWEAVKQSVTVDPLNNEAVRILRDMAERLDCELNRV